MKYLILNLDNAKDFSNLNKIIKRERDSNKILFYSSNELDINYLEYLKQEIDYSFDNLKPEIDNPINYSIYSIKPDNLKQDINSNIDKSNIEIDQLLKFPSNCYFDSKNFGPKCSVAQYDPKKDLDAKVLFSSTKEDFNINLTKKNKKLKPKKPVKINKQGKYIVNLPNISKGYAVLQTKSYFLQPTPEITFKEV